jgi:hypothetical protein
MISTIAVLEKFKQMKRQNGEARAHVLTMEHDMYLAC